MYFKNKTIWITGASSGIGKAMALAFSKYGANLILSARNEQNLNEVKKQCKSSEKVKILLLDLADFESFTEKVKLAISLFNGIDILINNGGISQRSLAINTELKVDQKIFEINYFGTIALTKALLPHFVNKKSGHIVVTSSVTGKIGTPLRSSYAASKHALHGFFDSLRSEIYDYNIDVMLVCPGFVNTDVSKNALVGDGSKQNTTDKATANGLNPDVVAIKILKAITNKKQEIVIGGTKEVLATYVKRFFPKLLSKLIRKAAVT
ncbi:MAG: SDR family oxidoreductase [Flavobacteriaceae bacterium]|nr:SDR family oxidoreductase [Flavobacteriaceae bacterium]